MPSDMVPAGLEIKLEAISAADFKAARDLMPTVIQKAVIEGVPMAVLSKATPNVVGYIEHELIILASMVNVDQRLNIQRHQLPVIAHELYEQFKTESIEDIHLCFRRGATGLYGEIYRLDAAVITGWMQKYLEEKYAVVEKSLSEKKADEPTKAESQRFLLKLMEAVAKETGIPPAKDPGNNTGENAYQRYKLERQTKMEFQKKLHRVSSDFYEKQGKAGFEMKVWYEEREGFEILAENEQDAERIYAIAKHEK